MSGDVTAMYTNIPTDLALSKLRWFYFEYNKYYNLKKVAIEFPYNEKQWKKIISILEWVLKNNYFTFGNKTFLQFNGTAMGTNCAPNFAQIFLGIFEWKQIYSNSTPLPQGYTRFVDDTWMMIKRIYIENTKNFIRNICEQLSWTFEIGTSVSFLDLLTALGTKYKRHQLVDFEPYEKPMNSHLYTSPTQNYPSNYKYSWIQGEGIRMLRNSSQKSVFLANLKQFKSNLLKREYPIQIINYYLDKVQWHDRPRYLTLFKPLPYLCKTITIEYHPLWNNMMHAIRNILCSNKLLDYNTILLKGTSIQNVGTMELSRMVREIYI
jgi:hypothetical protein